MKKFEFPTLPEMQMNFVPKPAKLQQVCKGVVHKVEKEDKKFLLTQNFTSISPTKHNIFLIREKFRS